MTDPTSRLHEHIPALRRYARALVGEAALADDLVQDCLERAVSRAHQWRQTGSLRGWLFTIARRTVLNHFRSVRKWEFVPADVVSDQPSPDRQLEQQERMENVWARARRVLSQREFEVLWLRFAEEMSTKETARITGLTQIHVKVLVHRARRQLMKGEVQT